MATCCHCPASNIRLLYIHLPYAIMAITMQDDNIYCNDIRPLCSWGLREHCIRTSLHWHMFLMIKNLSRVTHWWMTTKSTSCLGAEAAGCSARGEPWAARDSHGTDSAGSSPAGTCLTNPSQGGEQILGVSRAVSNLEHQASSGQQAGKSRPQVWASVQISRVHRQAQAWLQQSSSY